MASITTNTKTITKTVEVEEKVYNLALSENELHMIRVALYADSAGKSHAQWTMNNELRREIRIALGVLDMSVSRDAIAGLK